jgi:hypothetical protein
LSIVLVVLVVLVSMPVVSARTVMSAMAVHYL